MLTRQAMCIYSVDLENMVCSELKDSTRRNKYVGEYYFVEYDKIIVDATDIIQSLPSVVTPYSSYFKRFITQTLLNVYLSAKMPLLHNFGFSGDNIQLNRRVVLLGGACFAGGLALLWYLRSRSTKVILALNGRFIRNQRHNIFRHKKVGRPSRRRYVCLCLFFFSAELQQFFLNKQKWHLFKFKKINGYSVRRFVKQYLFFLQRDGFHPNGIYAILEMFFPDNNNKLC